MVPFGPWRNVGQSAGETALSRNEAAAAQRRSRRFAAFVAVLVALTAIRIVSLKLSVVELFYDEAQYWFWAQHPAFGYYSKPPLLAWVIAGAGRICGSEEWCVKAPAPIIYFAASVTVAFIGRTLYDETVGLAAGLLTALATGVVFSSTTISTDVPLLFFWAVALLAYVKFLMRPRIGWALVLGAAIGLGLLSKYAMIYFIPGMALAAFASRRAREALKQPLIWLSFLLAALIVSPNLAWNASHGFMTFGHTASLVIEPDASPSLLRALAFLATQFAVFGPVVFAVMILAAFKFKSSAQIEQDRLMVAFFVTPIVVVTVFAFFAHAYANWASPAVVSGLILTAAVLTRRKAWVWLWGSVALGAVFQMMVIVGGLVATDLPVRFLNIRNPYSAVIGPRNFAESVGGLATTLGAPTIANDSRGEVMPIRYYWRDKPQAVLSWPPVDEPRFDPIAPLTPSAAEPILFVSLCPDIERLRPSYGEIDPLGRITFPAGMGREGGYYAFILAKNRAPIAPLAMCGG